MNVLPRHLEAALGYLALGMHQDAWDELECLPPEQRANDGVSELRISIYQALGKWESARVLAESLAKRSPENPQWWILWAFSARREKSVADARAVLLEASKLHPKEALIPYNLACYSCVEGDIETATVLLKRAFELEPDLRKTALDDPDLDSIFGANYSEGAPVFAPPHLPDLNQK
jgi:tetratricopeptide (TPR) repeat protein